MYKKFLYYIVNKSMRRSIRIIGGKWRGRKIFVQSNIGVRPTLNRIRETLFNWLDPIICGAVCLDCFAGSGILGLESLSRGAGKVTFLDCNTICIVELLKVMQSWRIDINNYEIARVNCLNWLKITQNRVYDIVFIDPPFQGNLAHRTVYLLEQCDFLKKRSWVYIERSKKMIDHSSLFFPKNWDLYRKMSTKTIQCYLYLRNK